MSRYAGAQIARRVALVTLPDGVGIILAANILGLANHGRVTGPALLLKLCDQGRQFGLRHYFYGSRPSVADKLADQLRQRYPRLKIAGTYSPPFGETTNEQNEQIIAQINRAQPDILWVGLGAPRQEIWMADHHRHITAAAMIGVGAAFDFHSGAVKWAPAWIRSIGLEWAYRLLHEPKRLWRRNLDSPRFLFKVLAQRLTAPFRQPKIEEHELILKD